MVSTCDMECPELTLTEQQETPEEKLARLEKEYNDLKAQLGVST